MSESPANLSVAEEMSLQSAIVEASQHKKHLRDKEEQYVMAARYKPGSILAMKENEEGFWFVEIDKAKTKDIEKTMKDDSITNAWFIDLRFGGNGGWDIDNY